MKFPTLVGYTLLAVLAIHLVACQNITASDIQRLIELAQQARQASGK